MAKEKTCLEGNTVLLQGMMASRNPIILTDHQGQITFANPACERLLDYQRGRLLGEHLSVLYPPEAHQELRRILREAKVKRFGQGELELVRRDGTRIGGQVSMTLLQNEAGELGIIVINRDISRLLLLRKELERQSEELAVRDEILRILSCSPDFEAGLEEALERTLQLAGFGCGLIALVGRERDILVPRVHRGIPAALLRNLEQEPLRLDGQLIGSVKKRGEPLIIEDLTHDARAARPALKESGLRTAVIIPILAQWKVVGLLFLLDQRPLEVTLERLQLLQAVSNQMGVAVENVQLLLRERRRFSQLLLVGGIARKACSILDLERLLDEVAVEIQRAFNYWDVLIFFVDHDRGELVRKAWAGNYQRRGPKEQRVPIADQGILRWVVYHARTALVNDVKQDSRYKPFFSQTKSELCVPLRREGRVIGGINVESVQVNDFDETDVAVLETLADQLVVVIDNARFYRELEERVTQRTEALHHYEERLSNLILASPAVIYSCSPDGYTSTFITENVKAHFGYEPREFLEDPRFWVDRIHPEDAPRVFAELPRLFEQGHHSQEYRFRNRDGSYRWIRDEMRLVRDTEGNPLEIVGYWTDFTERKQMEEALRVSQERLHALSQVAAKIQGVLDEERIIALAMEELAQMGFRGSFWSVEEGGKAVVRRYTSLPPQLVAAWRQATGADPQLFKASLAGNPYLRKAIEQGEIVVITDVERTIAYRLFQSHPEALETFKREFGGAAYAPLKVRGQAVWLMTAAFPEMSEADIQTVKTFARHLSIALENARLFRELHCSYERLKQIQEELLQAERLAAIGQLSGSIAHHLRNPLGVIRNSIFYLKSKLGEQEEKVGEHLELIEEEILRADRRISDLLTFAYRGAPRSRKLKLKLVVERALAEVEFPPGIELMLDFGRDPLLGEADPDQMLQVCWNIINNALQAMTEGGKLLIRGYEEEGEAVLQFEDNGAGLSKEKATRVFEPLFTTKAHGTGLGLTICKQIIEAHRGRIDFQSREGIGTRVTVWIPKEGVERDG